MNNRIFLPCLALLLPLTAQALRSDNEQPLDVEADAVRADDRRGMTVLTGRVKLSQGTRQVAADSATLNHDGGDVERVELAGTPAHWREQLDDQRGMLDATAQRIDYDVNRAIVTLRGDVRIERQQGFVTGERIEMNLDTGQISAGTEDPGRVRLRLVPDTADTP